MRIPQYSFMNCSAVGCPVTAAKYPSVKCFRFPKTNRKRFNIWKEISGQVEDKRCQYLCERHFEYRMFYDNYKTRLVYNSCPAYKTGPLNILTNDYMPPEDPLRIEDETEFQADFRPNFVSVEVEDIEYDLGTERCPQSLQVSVEPCEAVQGAESSEKCLNSSKSDVHLQERQPLESSSEHKSPNLLKVPLREARLVELARKNHTTIQRLRQRLKKKNSLIKHLLAHIRTRRSTHQLYRQKHLKSIDKRHISLRNKPKRQVRSKA